MEVTDTGPGIPKEAHEAIFEPFRQADGTIPRKYGGTGLGLSIVKHLTTLMGGKIAVKSKVGDGSTFTVKLPLKTKASE
jgi:signal transduction histidine kinase